MKQTKKKGINIYKCICEEMENPKITSGWKLYKMKKFLQQRRRKRWNFTRFGYKMILGKVHQDLLLRINLVFITAK